MKRRQISELLNWYSSGTLKHDEAVEKILLLFDVMQRSEQLAISALNEIDKGECPICSKIAEKAKKEIANGA